MSQVHGFRPIARGGTLASILAVAILGSSVGHAAADATDPTGIWYTDGDESIIKVHGCGADASLYCGTLVWLKEPNESDGSPKLDKQNKDPAKRSRTIVGLDILLNLKPDDDHWTGKAYNPEDGKLYDVTFKVKTDKVENDQADLRGCLFKILCKTETFNRAKEVPGGDPTASTDAAAGAAHKHKPKKDSAHR